MAAARRKSSDRRPSGDDARARPAYTEFGSEARPEAFQRAQPDLPPAQQDLRVQVSRKGRGGKTVTEIRGLQHPPDKLKALLKKLKAQCGTGGTVREDLLEIQGDHADRLVEALKALGYRAKRSGG